MPDEVKLEPCPWCGSVDVETWRDRALLFGTDTLSVVFCNQCGNEVVGESDTVESAIAAWNALPRKQKWITYDGTEETFPMYGKLTLVEAKHGAKFAVYSYDFEIGDRWMPWPGGAE